MNNELFRKMMKSNIRQYRLFVLCNAVLVMVCYFFGGIYFNNMFVVFAFAVFFIPYTHFSFNLQNERKYGIMEATGVSWRDLWKFVLMENALLAVCSLMFGLAGGIMLLTLFFKVFVRLIGLDSNFPLISINSVLRPSLALLAIYALTVTVIMIRLSRITVKEKNLPAKRFS